MPCGLQPALRRSIAIIDRSGVGAPPPSGRPDATLIIVWFLLRFREPGAESQRRRDERDVVEVLSAAGVLRRFDSAMGRLYVDARADAETMMAQLHGVVSFSPCARCALSELSACIDRVADTALLQARSFCVSVRRAGRHGFRSLEKAAELGARIRARHPRVQVDMRDPDVRIGVEIREDVCFVFDRVIPGIDRRPDGAPPPHGAQEPRFFVDRMLAPLTRWLRLAGFDARYAPDWADARILRATRAQGRVLVTRDLELARSRAVTTVHVTEHEVEHQLAEVLSALDLTVDRARLLTRCTLCNCGIVRVDKTELAGRVSPVVRQRYEDFYLCSACDKIYWEGAHCERILDRLAPLLG